MSYSEEQREKKLRRIDENPREIEWHEEFAFGIDELIRRYRNDPKRLTELLQGATFGYHESGCDFEYIGVVKVLLETVFGHQFSKFKPFDTATNEATRIMFLGCMKSAVEFIACVFGENSYNPEKELEEVWAVEVIKRLDEIWAHGTCLGYIMKAIRSVCYAGRIYVDMFWRDSVCPLQIMSIAQDTSHVDYFAAVDTFACLLHGSSFCPPPTAQVEESDMVKTTLQIMDVYLGRLVMSSLVDDNDNDKDKEINLVCENGEVQEGGDGDGDAYVSLYDNSKKMSQEVQNVVASVFRGLDAFVKLDTTGTVRARLANETKILTAVKVLAPYREYLGFSSRTRMQKKIGKFLLALCLPLPPLSSSPSPDSSMQSSSTSSSSTASSSTTPLASALALVDSLILDHDLIASTLIPLTLIHCCDAYNISERQLMCAVLALCVFSTPGGAAREQAIAQVASNYEFTRLVTRYADLAAPDAKITIQQRRQRNYRHGLNTCMDVALILVARFLWDRLPAAIIGQEGVGESISDLLKEPAFRAAMVQNALTMENYGIDVSWAV